ncbi:MAG: hypothetical protein IPP52_01540 [Ignavibacteria bacterium]|nr:hypothetical protein [Ignavibacteria bacterium]
MKIKLYLISGLLFFFIAGSVFSQGFNSIHTPDGVYIIAAGNAGKIYRSTNAGTTWASYTVSSDNLRSVFSLGNDVWIGGSNGNVYKTTKSNSPVTAINTGSSVTLNSVCFVNANTGFVCGDGGSLYKTVNGGLNWSISNSGITTENLNAVSFSDENNGVAVSKGG